MKLLLSIITLCFMVGTATGESINDILLAVSKEINKNLPLRIDDERILETTVAVYNVLIYKYKITDDSAFKDPRFDMNKYRYYVRKSLGESVCSNKSTRDLFKSGASYNYVYVNKYGQKLFDYVLDESECLNIMSGER